jgi:GTP-binding protein Era
MDSPSDRSSFRCGQVAVVGRPNVGKSTLVNQLVGERVSITSKKAQTTRHRVTGIRTTKSAQFVFVDTPGIQAKHASRLNARMNRAARESLAQVDAIIVVIEAGRTTDADRDVVALLPRDASVVAALSKIDRLRDPNLLLPQMRDLAPLFPFAAIVPVSAEKDRGLDLLADAVEKLLPLRAALYDEDAITDRDERFLAAEFIREKIFRLLGDEVPLRHHGRHRILQAGGRTAADRSERLRRPREPESHPRRPRRRADEAHRLAGARRHGAPVRRQGVPHALGAGQARLGRRRRAPCSPRVLARGWQRVLHRSATTTSRRSCCTRTRIAKPA